MGRRVLALLAVLALCAPLHAEGRILTFLWDWDDFDVTAFRYQLDSEEDGGWTVCEYYQTSASFEDLDCSKPHSLYLQQSYDGIHWSASSVLSAAPPEEEAAGDGPAEEVRPEPPAEEAPPQETAAPLEAGPEKPRLRRALGLAGGAGSAIAVGGPRSARAGLRLVLEGIHSFSGFLTLDLEAGLLCDLALPSPAKLDRVSLSCLLRLSANLSPRLAILLPAGLETGADLTLSSPRFLIGLDLGAGLRLLLSERLSASAEGLFRIANTGLGFSATAALGLRF